MRRLLAVAGLAGLCSLALASSASAVPLVVDDFDDADAEAPTNNGICDGVGPEGCTLRAAIQEANNTPGPDAITFSAPGLHTLTLGALPVFEQVTITGQGSGPTGTRIDGGSASRVFSIATVPATLMSLRVQNGRVDVGANSDGGAGITSDGTLTLNDVTVTNNTVVSTANGNGRGGGIYQGQTAPPLTLINSSVTANHVNVTTTGGARGGGIYTRGPLDMTNSTVDGNDLIGAPTREGAGVWAEDSYDIDSSTISNNNENAGSASVGSGAGLFDGSFGAGTTKSIVNSTISGNSAGSLPGGEAGGARLTSNAAITNVTLANNTANGPSASLLVSSVHTATLKNTILGASFTANCATDTGGMIVSAGYNISNDASCNLSAGTNDQPTTGPGLDSLALNAPGTTETHALILGSPAINMGDPAANCGAGITADQRGVARPLPAGGRCDVGAFELEHQTLTVSTVGSGTVTGTGIGCPVDCSEALPRGTVVSLTPTPAAGFSFSGWSGACAGTGACSVTLDADKSVTASFTANPVATTPAVLTPPATTTPARKKKCKKHKKGAAAAKKCKKK